MKRNFKSSALALSGLACVATAAVAQQPPAEKQMPKAQVVVPVPIKDQILEQPAGTYMSRELVGATVRSIDQDNAGSVSDLIIMPDGKVSGVVIGVGGFLGLGARNIALPMEAVQIRLENGKPVVALTVAKADLDKAPVLKTLAASKAEVVPERTRKAPSN